MENRPAQRTIVQAFAVLCFTVCVGAVADVAHAGQTTFHRDLNDLGKQLDLARGPEVYATLRKIWGTWDRADPSHVEEALRAATRDPHLSAPARAYAGTLSALGRARRGDLKAAREEGESLLDRSMILYGSNLGDANAHSTINLPTLFAGGGFKHGQHLAFDTKNNYPLSNLYVTMLQRLGIEANEFSTSKGTMSGLEMA